MAAKNICLITASAENRANANKITGSIKDNFPTGIAQPALRALAAAGYTTLEQLAEVREKDLLALHGMGAKAIRILRDALAASGKSFLA